MKQLRILHFVLTACIGVQCAVAQAIHNPFNPVLDEPVELSVDGDYIHVSGSWIPLDKGSGLSGPAVSDIDCDRQQKTCHESQASMIVTGNQFSLQADSLTYKILRWNTNELVAQNIGGTCKALNVLKFDFQEKRVYWSQTFPEPSKIGACRISTYLELRASTMYWSQPTLNIPEPKKGH